MSTVNEHKCYPLMHFISSVKVSCIVIIVCSNKSAIVNVQKLSATVIALPSRELQCNVTEVFMIKSVHHCLLRATSCSTGEKALNGVDLAVEAPIGFGSVKSIPSLRHDYIDQYYAIHNIQ